IDVWRADPLGAEASDVGIAQVIGEDHHKVRWPIRIGGGLRHTAARQCRSHRGSQLEHHPSGNLAQTTHGTPAFGLLRRCKPTHCTVLWPGYVNVESLELGVELAEIPTAFGMSIHEQEVGG